jgi:hypothetical protein
VEILERFSQPIRRLTVFSYTAVAVGVVEAGLELTANVS